jgi:hypothetical protein
MHSYHHGIALHLKFLKLVLLSFGSKPLSTYISVDREKVLQNFEIGLNQFVAYLQKFQIKKQKRELEKF